MGLCLEVDILTLLVTKCLEVQFSPLFSYKASRSSVESRNRVKTRVKPNAVNKPLWLGTGPPVKSAEEAVSGASDETRAV